MPPGWDSWEFVREIRGGKLFSKTAAYGSSVTTNRLELKNPSMVNHLEADVAVTEIDGNYGPNANGQVTRASAGIRRPILQ